MNNFPQQAAPDPVIVPLHQCLKCGGHLADLHVHEGTTTPASRSKIVQLCSSCHKSHHHTPAYVHSDASHLLVRLNCRRFGRPFPMTQPMPLFVSHPSLRINLRLLVLFHALHSAVLISWTCCLDAANSDARSGRYRDSCKTHNAQGVQGHLAQALPHPHSVQPVNAPPSPPPTQLRLTSQCTPPSRPPAQASRRDQAVTLRSTEQSVEHCHNDNVRFDTSKVTRQKVDAIVAKPSNLVVYYSKGQSPLQLQIDVDASQTRLSDHPGLIEGLQINPASWLDLYANLEWKTMQASTYFLLDKHAPTLIRLRPSLLVELDLGDCPDIDKFIGKQS
ncbi:hypothetical protein B0H14DRAFT_3759998, partial [Mycena olivaceomarginata]